MSLGHFLGQTWRSIVSFVLSFFVLGLMVWFTPDWARGFLETATAVKSVAISASDAVFGYSQPGTLFGIFIGDTAIAMALMTLFTRVVVLTLILWIGQALYNSVFGKKS